MLPAPWCPALEVADPILLPHAVSQASRLRVPPQTHPAAGEHFRDFRHSEDPTVEVSDLPRATGAHQARVVG